MKLRTIRLGRHWWIEGDEDFGPYGPYDTKAEAEEDRLGLVRSARHEDEPGHIISDQKEGLT